MTQTSISLPSVVKATLVSTLDPEQSKTAFNAGVLKQAAFAVKDVRLCDVSWSVKGLTKK